MVKSLVIKIRNIVFPQYKNTRIDNHIFKFSKQTNKEDPVAELQELRKKFYWAYKRAYPQKNIEFGAFTYGKPDVKIWNNQLSLKIGKFCSIAQGVKIFLGGEHEKDWMTTYKFYRFLNFCKDKSNEETRKGANVVIGNDVWIGSDATIMSGVVVGNGCVIAANSLVTLNKQLPDYSIWGGVPAKQIGMRFPDETITKLRKIKWWDWPDAKLCDAMPLLLSRDIDALFEFDQGTCS
jgi:acetyltransferase-like isoleucine patch superfamily enzyme